MPPSQDKSWPLTIFLIKSGFTSDEQILVDLDKLDKREISLDGKRIGTLFVRQSALRPPSWVSFFDETLASYRQQLKSASVSAVFLLNTRGRKFALTFGHGRHLLQSGCFEENFGLHVTLNSITPERVRTIDRKKFDPVSLHLREQASREISIASFGLNIDQDLLRAVTGKPLDDKLGTWLTGRDALIVTAPTNLKSAKNLLRSYLKKSMESSYKRDFPWVDNISEVRDGPLRDQLNSQLVEKIKVGELDRIWLAIPELIDWRDFGGFKYRESEDSPRDDLDLSVFLSDVDLDLISVGYLKRRKAFCISASTGYPIEVWSIFNCIYAEVDTESGTYLLDNGKWYAVDRDYVESVNRGINQIPSTKLKFPKYKIGEREPDYNKRAYESDPRLYALMDQNNIPYGGGRSKIEFCDLYTTSKVMVHVKRYGGSSVLSQLFAQGVVAGSLFLADEQFRRLVNRRLPQPHRLKSTVARPDPTKYEICFAVISNSKNPLILPFFSKVSLRTAYQQLCNYGYRVTFAKIGPE